MRFPFQVKPIIISFRENENKGRPLRYLYTFLFYLALPMILVRLAWRARKMPALWQHWPERFGFCPFRLENTIWVHAVSVGESIAAIPLIKELKKQYPGLPLLVTSMTATGRARIKAAFGDSVYQTYVPYDLPGSVARFLDRVKPKCVVILETELWPNLITACQKRHIPLLVTNARLSEKSFKGYQKISTLTRQMLTQLTQLASQGSADRDRFIALGLAPEKAIFTGNLKFDLEIPAHLSEKGIALRQQLGKERPIWIAASTHAGEEEIILKAHQLILEKIPNALLVLVPRHPDRFDSVATLIEQQNLSCVRRSKGANCSPETKVYLGDTMGELLLLFSAVDVAFVAGSFAAIGGHNLLEPAALHKPVLSGPVLFNFTEISQKLLTNQALVIAHNAEELANQVLRLFQDEKTRNQLGERAFQVVEENRGALKKQFELIQSMIEENEEA